MGLDSVFFWRFDDDEKTVRMDKREMEMIWRPSYSTLGNRTQIFTHAFYEGYFSPTGFEFDSVLSIQEPFVDDPNLSSYNAPLKA